MLFMDMDVKEGHDTGYMHVIFHRWRFMPLNNRKGI